MASERDREIWDDATNAVCQAMQEQKMCNCPDGDCLAAKIDFSPEKIATATRPAPAATDTGLVTVAWQHQDYDEWQETRVPEYHKNRGKNVRELVTRSQAEELLAAERAEKEIAERNRDAARENFLTMQKSAAKLLERAEKAEADNAALIHDLTRIKDHETELVNDNAAMDARIKELETELENGGRVKGVNTQYANALAYLEMTEDDDPEEFAKRTWDERRSPRSQARGC